MSITGIHPITITRGHRGRVGDTTSIVVKGSPGVGRVLRNTGQRQTAIGAPFR